MWTKEETEIFSKRKEWRKSVFADTKLKLTPANYADYLELAERNLQIACRTSEDIDRLPFTVKVVRQDCLEAAADIVKKFGVKPVVLNMANSRHMGGGVESGCGAQEENMFRRTGCYLNRSTGLFGDSDMKAFEKGNTYTSEFSRHIYGLHQVIPVYDSMCFKKEEAEMYADRDKADVFPFFELRSAAQNLSHKGHFDKKLCKRQIVAQFNTLEALNVKAVVLSAFGCGAFKNPVDEVAQVYKTVIDEVLEKGACANLKVIIFALINPNDPAGDPGETLRIFDRALTCPSKAWVEAVKQLDFTLREPEVDTYMTRLLNYRLLRHSTLRKIYLVTVTNDEGTIDRIKKEIGRVDPALRLILGRKKEMGNAVYVTTESLNDSDREFLENAVDLPHLKNFGQADCHRFGKLLGYVCKSFPYNLKTPEYTRAEFSYKVRGFPQKLDVFSFKCGDATLAIWKQCMKLFEEMKKAFAVYTEVTPMFRLRQGGKVYTPDVAPTNTRAAFDYKTKTHLCSRRLTGGTKKRRRQDHFVKKFL